MKTVKFLFPVLAALLLGSAIQAQSVLPKWAKAPEAEQILAHEGFTVSYNNVTLCPNWSAWELTPQEADANAVGRTDFFTTDPLVEGRQAEYADYSGNKFRLDRGHMAPSADFKWSRTANEQTFYLTNVCPQDHTLNEGLWLEIEQRCRAWAKLYGSPVNIVCGPVHDGTRTTIGENGVRVPAAFFKCIMFETGGTAYAIAFILPNRPLDAGADVFGYAVSLKEIRRRTGLVPFPGRNVREPGKAFPFDIPWKKPKSR